MALDAAAAACTQRAPRTARSETPLEAWRAGGVESGCGRAAADAGAERDVDAWITLVVRGRTRAIETAAAIDVMTNAPPLARLLCLHGKYQSAAVLRQKLKPLQTALGDTVELGTSSAWGWGGWVARAEGLNGVGGVWAGAVFVDGPHAVTPKPLREGSNSRWRAPSSQRAREARAAVGAQGLTHHAWWNDSCSGWKESLDFLQTVLRQQVGLLQKAMPPARYTPVSPGETLVLLRAPRRRLNGRRHTASSAVLRPCSSSAFSLRAWAFTHPAALVVAGAVLRRAGLLPRCYCGRAAVHKSHAAGAGVQAQGAPSGRPGVTPLIVLPHESQGS